MQKARHHPIVKFFKNSWSILLTAGSLILIVALFVGISGNSSGGGNKAPDSTVNNGATDNDSSTNNGNSGNAITNDVDLFPSQTISSFVENTIDFPGWYFWTFPEVFEIKEGETYYVEWDGVTYICEGVSANYEGIPYTIVYLGNGSSFGYPSNDEPFAITYNAEVGISEVTAFTDSSESHTLRIYQKETVTLQLKDLTVTKNGTYTASLGEAYSSVNVNVPSTGVVDFPYELVEILPETELDFKFGASSLIPSTPAVVYADSDSTLSMIENNQVLESGDSGIVIWDGVFYAVYSGNRSMPPLVRLDGTAIFGQGISLFNSVGNISLPSVWDMSSDGKGTLYKKSNSCGGSDEPFFIVANSTKKADFDVDEFGNLIGSLSYGWGYVFASQEEPDFMYARNLTLNYLDKYNNEFYVGSFSKSFNPFECSVGDTFHVEWDNLIFTCVLKDGVFVENLDDGSTSSHYVYYLGNGSILGEEDSGEDFIIMIRPEDNYYTVGVYDSSVLVEDEYIKHRFGVYSDKERTHTVQIFKFVDESDS